MSNQSKSVLGIFKTRDVVEKAIVMLTKDGFSAADISVLVPDPGGAQDFVHTKSTKAPEGATAGASTGAAVGGTLGLLAGVGALAIPGAGPFIAAGPLMAALAGAGVGGAIGGIGGALIGFGIPEYEAKRFAGQVNKGGILLSVHAANPEYLRRAKKCLEDSGAEDISSTTDVRGEKPKAAPYADEHIRAYN